MDARVRRFRKRARQENRGRRGIQIRYSAGLRREAVSYLMKERRRGESVKRVAWELGVSEWSLVRWSRQSGPEAELRRVEVSENVAMPKEAELSLVTPEGYRIEGLDRRSARELLEALR